MDHGNHPQEDKAGEQEMRKLWALKVKRRRREEKRRKTRFITWKSLLLLFFLFYNYPFVSAVQRWIEELKLALPFWAIAAEN